MNCQNCDAPVLVSDERCDKCGARLLHRRVFLGTAKPEDFTLAADEPEAQLEAPTKNDKWQFDPAPGFEPIPQETVAWRGPTPDKRWGGFFRRVWAFVVDFVVIVLLCVLMGIMAYVGYKVGLAAHDRFISIGNAAPLMLFLTFGWAFLATAYFVVFHGMDGKTIGKRLLGLRVVGAEQAPITYRQAFLRWLGIVVAFAPLGLGVLWVFLNREKRGWHDFIARTWVIRD